MYNYITSGNRLTKKNSQGQPSRHTSTKAKEAGKGDDRGQSAKSQTNVVQQPTEEYVEMAPGEGEAQTPQDYEVPAIAYLWISNASNVIFVPK